MDTQQVALYDRIQKFSLDNPNSELLFSQRLARENGWTREYTQRVIEEYKKFAFLAVVAGHPVTPSDQVDQAWHLHLLYTQSYWDEFCAKVLGTPLHHSPTQGGQNEQSKFNDWYSKTLDSYQAFFEQVPPVDIWPPAEVHFGRDLHFVRVNLEQALVLPKWNFSMFALVGVLLLMLGTPWLLTQTLNPLNLPGREFLQFFILLTIAALGAAYYLRQRLREPQTVSESEVPQLDQYETAYLTAGRQRTVDTVIVELVEQGYLEWEPEKRSLKLVTDLPDNTHPLKSAVAQAAANDEGSVLLLRLAAEPVVSSIREQLLQWGLLLNPYQAIALRWYPALIMFSVLLLGILKILVGIGRHKPVGILEVLCVGIGWIGYWLVHEKPLYRSSTGDRLLTTLKSNHATLNKQNWATDDCLPTSQLSLAFALFGSQVLTSSSLAPLKNVLAPLQYSSVWTGIGGYGVGGCGGAGGGCGAGGGGCGGCGGG